MNKLRNILWKNLGLTLDKRSYFLIGIVSISCITAIVFGLLADSMNSALFRVLFLLALAPVVAIVMGSCYRPLLWSFSNKDERKEIEQDVALEQLKRRVNDPHFER